MAIAWVISSPGQAEARRSRLPGRVRHQRRQQPASGRGHPLASGTPGWCRHADNRPGEAERMGFVRSTACERRPTREWGTAGERAAGSPGARRDDKADQRRQRVKAPPWRDLDLFLEITTPAAQREGTLRDPYCPQDACGQVPQRGSRHTHPTRRQQQQQPRQYPRPGQQQAVLRPTTTLAMVWHQGMFC